MVALLAGAANAPLAASVMAIELFGPGIGPFAAIAAIVAFASCPGTAGAHPSQVLGMPKTRSLGLRRRCSSSGAGADSTRGWRGSAGGDSGERSVGWGGARAPATPGVSPPSDPAGPPDEGHRDGGRAEFLGDEDSGAELARH